VRKVECEACRISLEGDFLTSPLLNLPGAHQEFIELFVLSSGSLKRMAAILGVSYPTVRSRLNEIISELRAQIRSREDYRKELLERVEQGKLSVEGVAEVLRNL
jgi:hypothetical protein